MALYLNNPTIDALERRLRALPDGGAPAPTVSEIVNATSAAGSLRALARARGWAVGALRRIGADAAWIIGMMVAAEAAAQGRSVAFSPATIVPSLPAGLVTHNGEPVTHLGEYVTV